MCGITGQFSRKKNPEKQICERMLESIKHRGPDDSGLFLDKGVFLGHRRLSIQDLSSAGKQPMWDKEGEVCIIFNGEIYNFNDIKKDLSEYDFKSKTDTEVIIYAYKKWGLERALEKFNGMFSFCIYDRSKNKAYFVRDRLGIKPLVYYWDGEDMIFASELKAILESGRVKKDIKEEALADFFIYRYVSAPKTIFKNTYKLEPGHFLELDLESFNLDDYCYWELGSNFDNRSEEEIIQEIEDLIKDSINLRLISDTPVGSFLSGGIDSSLITTIAGERNPDIKAFSIDIQPDEYSEIEFARHLAEEKNLKLKAKRVGKHDFKQNFNDIVAHYDEPFADSSLVPTYLLCKMVREQGYKCVLSGDGADEMFYGYNWYRIFEKIYKMKGLRYLPSPALSLMDKITDTKLFSLLKNENSEIYRRIMFDRYNVGEINKIFGYNLDMENDHLYKEKAGNIRIDPSNINYLDLKTFLVDDILYKVDIASMANSLEVRVPFLDHRLVELVFSLKLKLLYKNKDKKYLLKKIARKYIPEKNIDRKKKGFSAPVMEWIGRDFYKEIMGGDMIKEGFVSEDVMKNFLDNEKDQGKIWQMFMFEKWFSHYLS